MDIHFEVFPLQLCRSIWLTTMASATMRVFGNNVFNLKLLIPAKAIGPIMGEKGSIIMGLERRYGVKICVSHFGDLYPGTADRVCLISGRKENVREICDYIIDNVYKTNPDHGRTYEGPYQLKVIIPEASAVRIIGNYSRTIGRLSDVSGSSILVSRAPFNLQMFEQMLFVCGHVQGMKIACRLIAIIIVNDANANFYQNVSYSGVGLPIPLACPPGPTHSALKEYTKMKPSFEGFATVPVEVTAAQFPAFAKLLEDIKTTLRNASYDDDTVSKTIESFNFLFLEGVLDRCYPLLRKYWNRSSDQETPLVTDIPSRAVERAFPEPRTCPDYFPAISDDQYWISDVPESY